MVEVTFSEKVERLENDIEKFIIKCEELSGKVKISADANKMIIGCYNIANSDFFKDIELKIPSVGSPVLRLVEKGEQETEIFVRPNKVEFSNSIIFPEYKGEIYPLNGKYCANAKLLKLPSNIKENDLIWYLEDIDWIGSNIEKELFISFLERIYLDLKEAMELEKELASQE